MTISLAKVIGVGVSSAYELMHEKGFPSVRIGKRFIVPRDDLKRWMEEQVAKKKVLIVMNTITASVNI